MIKVKVFIAVTTYSDEDVPVTETSSLPSRGLPDIGAFNEARTAEEFCDPAFTLSSRIVTLRIVNRTICDNPVRPNIFIAREVTFDWFLTDAAEATRVLEENGVIDDLGVLAEDGTLGDFEAGKLGLEDIADDDPIYGGLLPELFSDDDCDLDGFALELVVQEYCKSIPPRRRGGWVYYRKPFYPTARGDR